MLLLLDVGYRRLGKAEGIDWNYAVTGPCLYRFRLSATDKIPGVSAAPGPLFKNGLLEITRDATDSALVILRIAAGYTFDGCSVVPDFIGTVDASLPHDALYQFADDIAEAWGCSARKVMAFADLRFKDVMVYNNVPACLYQAYYLGVRLFGWPFNRLRKFWGRLTSK